MKRSKFGVFAVGLTMLSMLIGIGVPGISAQTGIKGSFEYTQEGTLQPVASPTVELKPEAKEVSEQINIVEHMIGRIDWENQIVYAVGEGVPPKDAISPAQARARAKRAAIDEAYAALLEAIQEVRVDAESTTRNFVNENRVARNKVEGFVKNAEVDELKQFDDGSFQVKMRMPMVGKGGLSTALYPAQRGNVVQSRTVYTIKQSTASNQPTPSKPDSEKEPSKATPAPGNEPSKEDPEKQSQKAPPMSGSEQTKAELAYTGLIVDAKGLNTKPALYPNILTEGGQKVYDIATPNPNAAIEEGLVGYRKSLEDAKRLGRVGTSPLVVKAKQIGGKYGADIVLSEEDARKILEADGRAKFLGEAKVVVVID